MVIQGKKVFIAGQFMPAQIVIEESKVEKILPPNSIHADIDYQDAFVIPGLIDTHTHGAFGYSVQSGEPDGLREWASKLPQEGVTAFVPTTLSAPIDVLHTALSNISDVMAQKPKGAQILGAHLEGPFLNYDYRGAHEPQYLLQPDCALFKELQNSARGNIIILTMACDLDKNYELTRYASSHGVSVSLGHSSADLEPALLALANGASRFTHSYNAMKGLHHRDPGVVGALMTSNAYAEIIADGRHVHPKAIQILFKSKPCNTMLISDSLYAKGLPQGTYGMFNYKIDIDQFGTAKISGTDTIAGSSLKLNKGIEYLVREAMIPLEQAILSATWYPACSINCQHSKGQISAGYDADITVLNQNWDVIQTYCLGEVML